MGRALQRNRPPDRISFTERELRGALAVSDNNIEHAARRLGIARRTLMKKMDDFGIPRPGKKI